jgi:cysteine-rich repeat protein
MQLRASFVSRLGFLLLASASTTIGCAAGNGDETGSGGDTGTSTTSFDSSSTTTSTAASMGCPENCAAVEHGPCQVVTCNMGTLECEVSSLADGDACDDGLYCTDGDTCNAGECQAGPARDCGESSTCGTGACDETNDECTFTPVANGTACVPTDPCQGTTNAICVNGKCNGTPKDCSGTPVQFPECQVAQCDPAQNGACIVVDINDGAACSVGGDICESGKICGAGACEGTPIANCTSCNETEANDTYQTGNTGMGCVAWAGAIATIGDKDFYQVDVTVAGSRIGAYITDVGGTGCPAGFDSVLRLFNSAGVQIADDDQGGDVSCSAFLINETGSLNLPVGTYYLEVEDYLNNGTSPPYLLVVGLAPPGCGDGILQLAEECDDGNTMDGDACSSTCELVVFDCAVGETQVILDATDLPTPIPDLGSGVSNITVAATGTVTKVGLVLGLTHGWDSDVNISLKAPNAASVDLSSGNGSSGDNYTQTVFSSVATVPITSGTAPFTGVYLPEGMFSTIVGTSPTGTWTLTAADVLSGFAGTLTQFKLALCVAP